MCGVALAGADPLDQAPLEPIDGAGVDCGLVPQMGLGSDLEFWNYDAAHTTCAEAVGILQAFHQTAEKYATVGSWDCGINGAAEADRTGILVRCVGLRGPLHALQVETPL